MLKKSLFLPAQPRRVRRLAFLSILREECQIRTSLFLPREGAVEGIKAMIL
jgi:hypothetical protein